MISSRFAGTSGSLGITGAVAAEAGPAAVDDADMLLPGAETFAADALAGTPGFAAAFSVFEDAFSDFPGAGAVVFMLAFVGAAPVPVFAAVATAGSACGCASAAGFEGCWGASFFAAESGSDFAAGAVGIIVEILSFSTSTYP